MFEYVLVSDVMFGVLGGAGTLREKIFIYNKSCNIMSMPL